MVRNASVSLDALKTVLSKNLNAPMVIYGRSPISVYDMLDGVERDYIDAADHAKILKVSNDRVVVVKDFDKLAGAALAEFRQFILTTKWRKALVIPTNRGFANDVIVNNRMIHITQIDL